MKQTVHKQVLEILRYQTIKVPEGSELQNVAIQYDVPCIWYKTIEGMKSYSSRRIMFLGTGEVTEQPLDKYLGTVLCWQGSLVYHVYEIPFEKEICYV
jgi:hypothetical protein